jgi:hypothetical protein
MYESGLRAAKKDKARRVHAIKVEVDPPEVAHLCRTSGLSGVPVWQYTSWRLGRVLRGIDLWGARRHLFITPMRPRAILV